MCVYILLIAMCLRHFWLIFIFHFIDFRGYKNDAGRFSMTKKHQEVKLLMKN
jgi:hypothetical protein